MSDWKVLERELLGDDPAAVKAGSGDARWARRRLSARAARAGAGTAAVPAAAAAYASAATAPRRWRCARHLDDPGRKAAAALALARIGAADAAPRLRLLADDPDATVRLSAAIGLYKAGERGPTWWSPWVAREPHVLVLGFLAAIAGTVTVDAAALTTLGGPGRRAVDRARGPRQLRVGGRRT